MRILGFIVLCFFLFLSVTTNAQISIGIKGGPDFSKMVNAVTGNDGSGNISTLNSGTITQFYGEIFADIPLDTASKMFYIRPGVEYIGAGGSTNATGNYYNSNGFQPSTRYNLHYVNVPVEFLYSPDLGWGRPWVGLGLYAGWLVNGTIKNPDGSSQAVVIGDQPNDNFQRVDLGYTFTFGLATKVGFLFGMDYQHGFNPIVPGGTGQNNEPRLHTHNSVWGLHAGWLFKL